MQDSKEITTGTKCHKTVSEAEFLRSIRIPKRAQKANNLIVQKMKSIEEMLSEPNFANFVIGQFENAGRKSDAQFIAAILNRKGGLPC